MWCGCGKTLHPGLWALLETDVSTLRAKRPAPRHLPHQYSFTPSAPLFKPKTDAQPLLSARVINPSTKKEKRTCSVENNAKCAQKRQELKLRINIATTKEPYATRVWQIVGELAGTSNEASSLHSLNIH